MVIAWTYFLHAYYRSQGIEYRYFKQGPKRRTFDKTKRGGYKYWELERCLNEKQCPLDHDTINNLSFVKNDGKVLKLAIALCCGNQRHRMNR